MKNNTIICLIVLISLFSQVLFSLPAILTAQDRDYEQLRAEVRSLSKLTDPPRQFEAAQFDAADGIKPIFFEAIPWQGKPTRVFAWLGLPKEPQGKVPGIVLVHGGGGSAFKEWVKLWNDQGFAAISIAVEGQLEEREKNSEARRPPWKRHAWGGPARVGIFADDALPIKEQWMYHALADTVLANSLLRSLPNVDEEKIGLMGISWGGVITSTAIGVDPRFAFAIPTYGCGHLFDSDNQWGRALGDNQMYRQVWDPMRHMQRVQLPVLWLSWPKDSHFPLDAQRASYQAGPDSRMVAIIPGMGHSHQAGWRPPDSYAFAKSVVEEGKPWCQFKGLEEDDRNVTAMFASTKRLDAAVLVSTTDTGFTGSRKWVESPATTKRVGENWSVTGKLPPKTTAWFVNVKRGNLTVSSDFQGQ